MSVGWNPFYKNTKRSAVRRAGIVASDQTFMLLSLQEVHILHQFDADFYGEKMRMLVLGYIRPEMNFNSLGRP